MQVAERRLRRFRRRKQFELFRDLLAEPWFHSRAKADPRHEYFGRSYSFYVVKGGRRGGKDTRTVEVFYGNRPVDQTVDLVDGGGGLPHSRTRFVIESGASLEYRRTDRGSVFCVLSPARSEGYGARETGLVLAHIESPSALQSPARIDAHWRALMSYFECTALDGDPRWSDHLRVAWLRLTRTMIVGKVSHRPAWQTGLIHIFTWGLTIGLSGVIVVAVQYLFGAPGAITR